jgi:hypothetical protein
MKVNLLHGLDRRHSTGPIKMCENQRPRQETVAWLPARSLIAQHILGGGILKFRDNPLKIS